MGWTAWHLEQNFSPGIRKGIERLVADQTISSQHPRLLESGKELKDEQRGRSCSDLEPILESGKELKACTSSMPLLWPSSMSGIRKGIESQFPLSFRNSLSWPLESGKELKVFELLLLSSLVDYQLWNPERN